MLVSKKRGVLSIAWLLQSVLLLLLAAPPSYAEGELRSVRVLSVRDALGRIVGKIIGFSPTQATNRLRPVIAFRFEDEETGGRFFFRVLVERDQFRGNTVYYESSNCTGIPFLESPPDSTNPMPEVGVAGPGNTVYIQNSDHVRTINVQSLARSSDEGCVAVSFSIDVFPAKPLIDLDTKFMPPYEVVGAAIRVR